MRGLCVAGLALVVTSSWAAPAVTVLNTNMTIDIVNAATNADAPLGSNPFQSDSLAKSPTGTLYTADAGGVIWSSFPTPAPVGPTGFTQIGDLDYGSNGLWGFSNASQSLFFFNLGTLTVTSSLNLASLSSLTVTGVAFQPSNGSVFLSARNGLNNDFLYEVPFSATSANLIGSMTIGDGASYISDIDFDSSGNLYAMTFFHRYFYTVSTSTAATSLVSVGPHRDTTAMALDPVPEPATVSGLLVGAIGLARRLWRKGNQARANS